MKTVVGGPFSKSRQGFWFWEHKIRKHAFLGEVRSYILRARGSSWPKTVADFNVWIQISVSKEFALLMKEPIRAAGDLDHWFDKNVLIKQHCLSQAYCLNWDKQLQRSCVSSAVSETGAASSSKNFSHMNTWPAFVLARRRLRLKKDPLERESSYFQQLPC